MLSTSGSEHCPPAAPRWARRLARATEGRSSGRGSPASAGSEDDVIDEEIRSCRVDLFEYQGKEYFARYQMPVSPGEVVDSVAEAEKAAERLGYPVVVKAQVQVGGRGKAGGVKLAGSGPEVSAHAAAMLGMDLKGHRVRRLLIEKASEIEAEYYVSFTLDRAAKRHLCMVSARGGVEIEQVAEEDPDAIARLEINPILGLTTEDARDVVARAGLPTAVEDQVVAVLHQLYRCYVEGDADLAEINPLILTPAGKIHVLDAKVTLDDDAAFRHPEWAEFADFSEIDEREALAKQRGLNYIGLDGAVGIIANGAGLAMSTLDVVSQAGGAAANFLDIGGGANAEIMASALEVINTDPAVRAIFINIFGGIVRCDDVARGILTALERVELACPIVMRLDGTNVDIAREILAPHQSDRLIFEPTMLDGARRAVAIAGGAS
jgi:succinyl-CoA synthetase beta subunit